MIAPVAELRPHANAAPAGEMDRRIERPLGWRKRRRALVLAAVALLAIAAAALLTLLPASGSLIVNASEVEVGQAARAPFVDYLPLRAEAQPLRLVMVTSTTGGQVAEVIIRDGAAVQAGQPLAHLTNPELRQQVAEREVEIASRLADLTAQELALQRNRLDLASQVAEANNQRLGADHELTMQEQLHAMGFVQEQHVISSRRDSSYREAQVRALTRGQAEEATTAARQLAQIRETAALLRQNLAVVRASLGDLVLRAPISGTLTGFTVQPGQSVAAGDALGQVAEGRAYKLVAEVDEFYLGRVSVGQTATGAIEGSVYGLVVSNVLPQVTNGRFRVEFTFIGVAPTTFRTGQAVDVRVTLSNSRSAVVAPAGAWVDAGGVAFVASPTSDQFDRRQLRLGRRTQEQVEVLSGVIPGERLITSSAADYAGIEQIQIRPGGRE